MFLIAGVDGLTTMYEIEPYSMPPGGSSRVVGGKVGNSGMAATENKGGRGGGGGGKKSSSYKTSDLCRKFNSAAGCERAAADCRFKHWCNHVDPASDWVCKGKDHAAPGHK
jgi:hypothetical protein